MQIFDVKGYSLLVLGGKKQGLTSYENTAMKLRLRNTGYTHKVKI